MKRICIVDDQQISIDAAVLILGESANIEIVGTFTSAELFVDSFDSLRPDLTIIDLDLPGLSGIEAIMIIKASYCTTNFLVLTNYSDDERLFNALKSGADGYLLKKNSYANLEAAILSVFDGGGPMTPEIAQKMVRYFQRDVVSADFLTLTAREKEVLELLSEGYLYKEIAEKISVATDTVKKHASRIYEKLHVRSRSEALKKYFSDTFKGRL